MCRIQNVQDSECLGFRMCRIQNVQDSECVGFRMFRIQNVQDSECVGFRMCRIQNVQDSECVWTGSIMSTVTWCAGSDSDDVPHISQVLPVQLVRTHNQLLQHQDTILMGRLSRLGTATRFQIIFRNTTHVFLTFKCFINFRMIIWILQYS